MPIHASRRKEVVKADDHANDKFSYLILCGLPIGFGLWSGYNMWFVSFFEFLKSVTFCFGVAGIIFLWIKSFKIIIHQEGLTYTSLFQGTRTIRFDDILKANDQYVVDTQLNGLRRFNIWRKDNPKTPYIAINLKMFKKPDVKHLLDVLKPYKKAKD